MTRTLKTENNLITQHNILITAQDKLAHYIGENLPFGLTEGLDVRLTAGATIGRTDLSVHIKGKTVAADLAGMTQAVLDALANHPALEALFGTLNHPFTFSSAMAEDEIVVTFPRLSSSMYAKLMNGLSAQGLLNLRTSPVFELVA
jgi:hypothetical protein